MLGAFSFGSDPYAGGLHRGIDIGAAAGATVVAPADGVVSFSGTVPTGGRTLAIQTPDGYSVTLLHLGSVYVGRGAEVGEGDAVAFVGSSGVSEQPVPYAHLGIRRAAEPEGYVDPLLFLPPPVQQTPQGEPPTPDPVPVVVVTPTPEAVPA